MKKQEIYIDLHNAFEAGTQSIYDMPKKDRVVVGDRLDELRYFVHAVAFSHAWNFADVRVAETEKFLFCYYEFEALENVFRRKVRKN